MSVVACPKCTEKVTLPPKTPSAAKVRCPLCGEQYLLSEAMSTLPPMLEVIELPDGFSEPREDVSISTEAFLASADRSAPAVDDGDDLKLQGEGAVATAQEETRYDQWGAVSSSTPAYDLAGPQVKRELLPARPRRKKKGVNPLFHVVGIVLGGVVAIPAALLILLWMPGSLQRDPLDIGPWLGKNVPYIVPAKFRSTSDDTSTGTNDDSSASTVASKSDNSASTSSSAAAKGEGLQLGNKFDQALNDSRTSFGPGKPAKKPAAPNNNAAPELDDTPLLGGPSTGTEPAIEPVLDTNPEKTKTRSEPAVAPKAEPDAEKPEAKTAPTKSEDEPKPSDDPLLAVREALVEADRAFNEAAAGQEKKTAAMAMYRAAARLAEELPADATGETGLEILVADPMKLQVVGVATASWLDNEERGTNGVVLSGSVKSCQAAGERFELHVELPSRDKREVIVITTVECEAGDRVFVAGRIVDNAKGMIEGYEGEAAKAIDARVVQKVEP